MLQVVSCTYYLRNDAWSDYAYLGQEAIVAGQQLRHGVGRRLRQQKPVGGVVAELRAEPGAMRLLESGSSRFGVGRPAIVPEGGERSTALRSC